MADLICDRCSGTLTDHVFYGWNCIGCARPPVLFRCEILEVKPYDYPITKIIEGMDDVDRASAIPVLSIPGTKIEGV